MESMFPNLKASALRFAFLISTGTYFPVAVDVRVPVSSVYVCGGCKCSYLVSTVELEYPFLVAQKDYTGVSNTMEKISQLLISQLSRLVFKSILVFEACRRLGLSNQDSSSWHSGQSTVRSFFNSSDGQELDMYSLTTFFSPLKVVLHASCAPHMKYSVGRISRVADGIESLTSSMIDSQVDHWTICTTCQFVPATNNHQQNFLITATKYVASTSELEHITPGDVAPDSNHWAFCTACQYVDQKS